MSLPANTSLGSITGNEETTEQKRKGGKILDFINKSVRLVAGGGTAEVVVNKSNVIIATDANTAIGLTDGCIILDGKVLFTHRPDDICINTFWRLNQDLLTEIPSTLMNPVETLVFKYPNQMKKSSKVIAMASAMTAAV